ncbi:SMP-30/gluconolactonase/LRE family protein [Nannocystis punicea]|uniref:SMP-30/gluconolactonase/LRE family protein n=1 Tax=Nannocystis punicea TaxID=2995304 RepID=A0ABY7HAN7_9BACT|nr:SMP-30/gluconolactonase/LRE family protein [Nannocystis poenicansa]WAS96326.1 SMP-30/gluconolactonase/LRE family protein [Nannocystis poenicansa]
MVRTLAVVVGAAVLFGAGEASAGGPSLVRAFDPAQGELPESITTDWAGNLYMSMGPTVKRLKPNGQLTTLATPPVPEGTFMLGLKFGWDGYLYAGSGAFAPEPAAAFVWRINPITGHTTEYAALDPLGFPNDLAFDDRGDLYVTDPFLGVIWKIDDDGDADVWLADPSLEGDPVTPFLPFHSFGVDGIAFDRWKRNLYVGNLDYGTIVRIPIECHGEPGEPEVWVDDYDKLAGADGIAFDADGDLYVAVNGQDRLVRVDDDGDVHVLAQGGLLDAPSSVVFGQTLLTRKKLYVTSFAINRALGVVPGTPHPALLSLSVSDPGLLLP